MQSSVQRLVAVPLEEFSNFKLFKPDAYVSKR